MINLPDWQNIHNIIIKCENRLKNRRIIFFPAGPFPEADKNPAYAIRFENRLIFCASSSSHHAGSVTYLSPDSIRVYLAEYSASKHLNPEKLVHNLAHFKKIHFL